MFDKVCTEATAEAALPLVLRPPASVPCYVVTVLVLVIAGHGGVRHVVAGLGAQATGLQQGENVKSSFESEDLPL